MKSISSTSLFAMLCITIFICLFSTIQSTSIYSLIVESVVTLDNFPVSDYASIEFTYATPETSSEYVLIIVDLQGTNLGTNTDGTGLSNDCYVGGGLLPSSDTALIADPADPTGPKRFFAVRSSVLSDAFFQLTCRFATPSLEQLEVTKIAAALYEVPSTASPANGGTVQSLTSDALTGFSSETKFQSTTPSLVDFGTDASFDLPPIFTESTVFTFHYTFEPQGRRLLNDTELAFILSSHYTYVNEQSRIKPESVLLANHYAEYPLESDSNMSKQTFDFASDFGNLDYFTTLASTPRSSDVPKALHVIIYTKGTTSQYDFKLGIQKLIQVLFSEYSNPLVLNDLSSDASWVYRSNCYNGVQDFDETGLDCGSPDEVKCGRCLKATDICTLPEQCASGSCGTGGLCEVDYGTFFVSASFSTSFSVVLVIVTILASAF